MRKFTTLLVMVIIAGGCRTVDERRTADAQPMRELTFHLMTAITEPDPSLSKAERDRLDAEYNKTYRDAFINDTREYGVTWPKGSDAVADYWCATITVTNTPENLIKIIGHERLLSRRWRKITVNARFVEADHKALEAIGLDSMKRIDDADVIFEQLKKRDDVRLLEAFRQNAKNGQECVLKRVTEYIYPTEFNVVSDGAASASNSVPGTVGKPVVEPAQFETREVGALLQLVPEIREDLDMIDVMLNAEYVDEPVWMDYGMEVPGPDGRTYKLPIEQPFFPCRGCNTALSVPVGKTVLWMMGGLSREPDGQPGKMLLFFLKLDYDREGKPAICIFPKSDNDDLFLPVTCCGGEEVSPQ